MIALSILPSTSKQISPYARACLETLSETALASLIARRCSAWDFGLLPKVKVVEEVRKPDWREAIDACQLLTSPTYPLLREWQGLPSARSWVASQFISWKT